MEHNCERHTFEVADGECRSCLGSFCLDCLIYPFGADQPPYCKPCALTAGGIRSTARNPRRTERVAAKAATSSGGLLRRFRRGGSPLNEPGHLTPEERIEAEAEEARHLLDAQRLPTEVEEEPEPEPTPTPNIAPPAAADIESELTHRSLPDTVAGGLDLGGDGSTVAAGPGRLEQPRDTPAAEDDRPAWARPEAAEVPPSDAWEPEAPAWDSTADRSDDDPVDAAGPIDSPVPPVEAPPALADRSEDPRPPVVDRPAVTADGNALFSTPSEPEPDPVPPASDGGPPRIEHERSPLTSSLADMVEDTDELLRRIADLKGA